jgi:ubiquinone/menaquinone biosynthesis C-methylase UbiE
MEQAGWQQGAASYDELLGSVTRQAIEPLLDAAAVRSGTDLLELCCGTGHGAGAAAARGARVVGVDFAAAMVEAAARRHPGARFEHGDAEALRFADASFDAVTCAFGVNHLAQPERSMAEAHRVLRPGGHYAFSMWCAPDKSRFHGLVLDYIRVHGTLDVVLPPAPAPFRFSDPAVCLSALHEAGFAQPRVSEIELAFHPARAEQVLELTYTAVRLKMILGLQTERARQQIHRAIVEGAERFRTDGGIVMAMPALLAVGHKAS